MEFLGFFGGLPLSSFWCSRYLLLLIAYRLPLRPLDTCGWIWAPLLDPPVPLGLPPQQPCSGWLRPASFLGSTSDPRIALPGLNVQTNPISATSSCFNNPGRLVDPMPFFSGKRLILAPSSVKLQGTQNKLSEVVLFHAISWRHPVSCLSKEEKKNALHSDNLCEGIVTTTLLKLFKISQINSPFLFICGFT